VHDSHGRSRRLPHIAIATARYNKCVKAAIPLLATTLLCAQTPVKIDYACPPEDINSFGLACSAEDPCPVFLELTAVEAVGAKLFLAGNLHTQNATLRSILLTSDDGAKTWTEPFERIRAAAFEQIQFADFANGWVSGQIIEPLPRDPFVLLSTDGGKTWRQRPVFEESRIGTIADFWFESRTAGEMVIDHQTRGVSDQHRRRKLGDEGSDRAARQVERPPQRATRVAHPCRRREQGVSPGAHRRSVGSRRYARAKCKRPPRHAGMGDHRDHPDPRHRLQMTQSK
jgi:hypothetical protein